MPPQLAAAITYAFVGWLFLRDQREKPNITNALWLPVVWFVLVATRHPSQWLALWGIPGFTASSTESGSNLDAAVYLLLLSAGTVILLKRGFRFEMFISENKWLVVFLIYCFVAIVWADSSFVAFKRWIKILGHPVMVLLVLTEPEPPVSINRLIKRCSYILIPISIMLIKYFPMIGRKGGGWATHLDNVGITTGKNLLGANCFVLGIFLGWFFMKAWNEVRGINRTKELRVLGLLIGLNAWCLVKAGSMTSWLALILGLSVLIGLRKPSILDRKLGILAVVSLIIITTAESQFQVSAAINHWRGKGDTVEGRGRLWDTLLDMDTDPLIGTGFESFWMGERLEVIWEMPEFSFWKPTEAHNGYLEIYLTLGALGLLLLGGVFVDAYRYGSHGLSEDRDWERFRLACLFSLLTYNWMEAAFRGLSLGFFLFFFMAVRFRDRLPNGEILVAELNSQEHETRWRGSEG